jgi:arylsulfatase A-like enzyme
VFGAEQPGLIADGRMTIAPLLREHGYATAMVGKWHLGQFPRRDHGPRLAGA